MDRIAVPGEFLGTIEEYVPGHNVIEIDGKIFSSVMGKVEINEKHMMINVKPIQELPILKVGEIVYGVVQELYNEFALVTVVSIEGFEREIVGGRQDGIIHISKISEKYVDEIGKMFRIGDIVRAKVIKAKPSLQLTTAEPHLGVVKALCMKCRSPLKRENNILYCERCGRKETRKIAVDYGNIKIKVKIKP
ncbi:MAG: exosome complex RNA-binding protein Csl4 [Thermoplasmata archaeon]|jgi:exosome complex component CSL4|nr:S1 RNA-binding domain-containing protein [Thermoplasmatales archaeon]PMP73713.1 MAG: RNA-binding protein [Aciduliprofundum sp.]HEU12655.1 S1 RNA-binding domain-containing protein [Euryarchaeota archaeon]